MANTATAWWRWPVGVGGAVVVVFALLWLNRGFVPNRCRAMQSEAKIHLKNLFVAEHDYADKHQTFTTSLAALAVKLRTTKQRYDYRVVSADAEHFVVTAVGRGEMAGDVWQMSDKNDLHATANRCLR